MNSKPKYWWLTIRVSFFLEIVDGFTGLIFGRSKALCFKFISWQTIRELERKISERDGNEA